MKPGFSAEEIRVYEGDLALPVTLPRSRTGPPAPVTLRIQVCSDTLCLDPVAATFRLPQVTEAGASPREP